MPVAYEKIYPLFLANNIIICFLNVVNLLAEKG